MNGNFQFQYPWVLGLLALLPVYAFFRGHIGKLSALRFSSADIARAAALMTDFGLRCFGLGHRLVRLERQCREEAFPASPAFKTLACSSDGEQQKERCLDGFGCVGTDTRTDDPTHGVADEMRRARPRLHSS